MKNVKQAKYFRSIKFSSLTESEYSGLKERGMLYEYYPQATGSYMKDMINENIRESRIDDIGQNGNDGLHYSATYNHQMVDLEPKAKHDTLWPYGAGDAYINKMYLEPKEEGYEAPKDHMFEDNYNPVPLDKEQIHKELAKDHMFTDDYIQPEDREEELPVNPYYNDPVSPNHYQLGNTGVEVIEVIRASLTDEQFIGYCRGNIIKYNLRANKKNGTEDLKKADVYSAWLLEELEG